MADVENKLVDQDNDITYIVKAGRQLTRQELIQTVRVALSMMPKSKRPKAGETITLHTGIGKI